MKYEDIQSKLEDLHNILSVIDSEAADIERRLSSLDTFEKELSSKREKLEKDLESLDKERVRVGEEREFNKRVAIENRLRGDGVDKKLVEVKVLNEEYEKKRKELIDLNSKIDEKMKKVKLIDEREAYLKQLQSEVNKQAAINKEVSDKNKWDEQKNKERADYLEKIVKQ